MIKGTHIREFDTNDKKEWILERLSQAIKEDRYPRGLRLESQSFNPYKKIIL